MAGIWDFFDECHKLGIKLEIIDGQLKIHSSKPLPENLAATLQVSKEQILAELSRRNQDAAKCWTLGEWRRLSVPGWRRILRESIEQKDRDRERYARWMLKEVLEDPDFEEN
jgi:hypothetical protein